jgi:hypothetical protein
MGGGSTMLPLVHGCKNTDCQCHQEKPTHEVGEELWEGAIRLLATDPTGADKDEIISIVKSLLTHQKESMVSKLEGMKKGCVGGLYCSSYECPAAQYNKGFADAIEVVRLTNQS